MPGAWQAPPRRPMGSPSLLDLQGPAASVLPRQARLDVLDVAIGLRPSARILARPGPEVRAAASLIEVLGLDACVARGLAKVPVGRSFADSFAPGDSAGAERMAILYVAGRRESAEWTRSCDERCDDEALGEALGYPLCCVRAMLARGRVPSMADAVGMYSARGGYDPLVWPPAAVADGPLLPHFPCSAGCEASRMLALARWHSVRSDLPELAMHVSRAAESLYWVDGDGIVHSGGPGSIPVDVISVVRPGDVLPRGRS